MCHHDIVKINVLTLIIFRFAYLIVTFCLTFKSSHTSFYHLKSTIMILENTTESVDAQETSPMLKRQLSYFQDRRVSNKHQVNVAIKDISPDTTDSDDGELDLDY